MERIDNNEKFVKRMNTLRNDIEILDEWNGSQTKLHFRHLECGNIFEATPNNMLKGKEKYNGCPACAKISRMNSDYLKRLTHSIDDVKDKVKELYPNGRYELLSTNYVNNKEPLEFRCNKCKNVFKMSYVNFCKGKGCKYCNAINRYSSKGTIEIERCLNDLNLKYEREVSFEECKRIRPLYFDFLVYSNNKKDDYILIEFDGELHYRPFDKNYNSNKTKFDEQKERDAIKDKFCKDYNIPLIRISYRKSNKIESIIKQVCCKFNLV